MPRPSYGFVIAILHSTRPLAEALIVRLFQSAAELHHSQVGMTRLAGDLAQGEVRSLGKRVALGTFGGPGFEADLETPAGRLQVRFLLTQEGIDVAETERHCETPNALN